jgi:hypothetical protein
MLPGLDDESHNTDLLVGGIVAMSVFWVAFLFWFMYAVL